MLPLSIDSKHDQHSFAPVTANFWIAKSLVKFNYELNRDGIAPSNLIVVNAQILSFFLLYNIGIENWHDFWQDFVSVVLISYFYLFSISLVILY